MGEFFIFGVKFLTSHQNRRESRKILKLNPVSVINIYLNVYNTRVILLVKKHT